MKRVFSIVEGTKRVEDPNAVRHPCNTCGNTLTIALYDVVDGYLLPKETPFPENVMKEHKADCEYALRNSYDHKLLDVRVVKLSNRDIKIITSALGSPFSLYEITLDEETAEKVGLELIRVSDKK